MPFSLFISDLHLSDDTPEIMELFLAFLKETAPQAEQLYILGDLFDAWVGDDDDSTSGKQVIDALAALSGFTDVFFIHGNRDFLVGEQFSLNSHVTLLPDPAIISIGGQHILITHGDQLCTDDVEYQKARIMRCNPEWIREFLSKPLQERKQLAVAYRKMSGETKSGLAEEIMDVNEDAVINWFEQFDVNLMIHGHTHRPATHDYLLEGEEKQRIVLPEWYANKALALQIDEDLEMTGIPIQRMVQKS